MRSLALLLLWLPAVALAQEPPPSPTPSPSPVDITAARQYYDLGAEAYEKGDYPAALRAFDAAWAEAPHSDLLFNIARCHERMGHFEEAAQAYERYLQSDPAARDKPEMRSHIADLHRRASDLAHLAPAAPADRPWRVGAGATLGVTLVLAGAGAGAYLSAWSEYSSKKSACQSRCAPGAVDGLRTRVESAQVGGIVLFALAGAALITDVALWVLDARARR
jgi:tetratricopeptide (TPR) repeat protein